MNSISIAGQHLQLVSYTKAHAEHFFAWFYSPDYQAYFRDDLGLQLQPNEFDDLQNRAVAAGGQCLTLLDQRTQVPVGLMNFALHKKAARVYRFGVMLDKAKQGAGFCIEACRLLCEVLFTQFDATKMICDVSAEDLHLNAVIKKGGFVHEATLKQETVLDGRFIDENRYVMFREPFLQLLADFKKDGVWNRFGR